MSEPTVGRIAALPEGMPRFWLPQPDGPSQFLVGQRCPSRVIAAGHQL